VDLKALALIDELPDVCFNEALRAVRQNRWAEAVQQLATAIHYRPGDGEVWIVLGKVYAQLQRMEEALTCFARAQMCGSGEEAADCMRACGVKPFDGSDLMGA
jgi:Flp pilus assembly protein TadD